jgi:ornithine cyclodeaminase
VQAASPLPALIDRDRVATALPYIEAVDLLAAGFRSERMGAAPLRSHMEVPGGELLIMPAALSDAVGVKLVTLNPANPSLGYPLLHGAYVLFAGDTLAPRALLDGAALTAFRTAAVSALATRYLANEDAHHLVVFGAGAQAHAHLDAICAVRPIGRLSVIDPNPGRTAALIEAAAHLGLAGSAAEPAVVAEADVICTCTTSRVPVFAGGMLKAGAHVNAIGSYRPDARELDDDCVRRATLVVEDRRAALAEAGDLLLAIDAGTIAMDDIAGDLGEVVEGTARRLARDEITVFKSVGLAMEDLVLARAIADRALVEPCPEALQADG